MVKPTAIIFKWFSQILKTSNKNILLQKHSLVEIGFLNAKQLSKNNLHLTKAHIKNYAKRSRCETSLTNLQIRKYLIFTVRE